MVLKDSRTPLRDGDRELPNRGECLFRIARLGADMADIVTEDGTVRGWVKTDQILPLETAAEHFSRRIAAAPGDGEAYQTRGRIWIEKEEWDRALADLDAAIRLAPDDPRSHHLRGVVLARKKELVKAIAEFSEAIRLDPAFALAFRDRGLAWDARRFFDQAIADLNEAVRLDPGNLAFLLSRGRVCSSRGRHNQAMADFESVIRMQPGDPTGYVARGEELMEDLQSEAAIADFTRALELDPNLVSALVLRAKAWRRRFDYARAIADLAEATRRAPTDPEPHRALAWLLATCPQREFRDGPRAVQEGTAACELTHWNNPECLDALAAAYAEAGDFASAVKWQTRAVELAPPRRPNTGRLPPPPVHVRGEEAVPGLAQGWASHSEDRVQRPGRSMPRLNSTGVRTQLPMQVALHHRPELPIDLKAHARPFSRASSALQPWARACWISTRATARLPFRQWTRTFPPSAVSRSMKSQTSATPGSASGLPPTP